MPRTGVLREYIGSDENRLVQFAAQALLEGTSPYNPLVFHGPAGTGKTLLALGLAERWSHDHPDDRVLVTCGADFGRAFANAADTDDLPGFRRRFRSIELFVVDDVDELQRKEPAQRELIQTLDELLERGSALVLTLGTPSASGASLLPALRSRLAGGLSVPLVAPGIPARRALLRRLLAIHELELSDDAFDLLADGPDQADRDRLTVPQLNHAVVHLGHMSRTSDEPIDASVVRRFLADAVEQRKPTLRSIATRTARYFSITTEQLRGPSRRRNVVRARGVAMFLSRKLTTTSLENVGKYFGKRDHTTVLHACRTTGALCQNDPTIAKAIDDLLSHLQAPT